MSVTTTEKKCDCLLALFRTHRGESVHTAKKLKCLIHLVEAQLDIHPFWFGIIELPFRDDNLLHNFIDFDCHVFLEDGRQASGVICRVFAKEDYMAMCVSGRTKLMSPEEYRKGK
jgi:hypothetical protein